MKAKAGRKALSASGEIMKPRQIRMTDAEWEACKKLGGAQFVRSVIKTHTRYPYFEGMAELSPESMAWIAAHRSPHLK